MMDNLGLAEGAEVFALLFCVPEENKFNKGALPTGNSSPGVIH